MNELLIYGFCIGIGAGIASIVWFYFTKNKVYNTAELEKEIEGLKKEKEGEILYWASKYQHNWNHKWALFLGLSRSARAWQLRPGGGERGGAGETFFFTLSHEARIHNAMQKVLKMRDWSKIQIKWLQRIEKQLLEEYVISKDDFDKEPFRKEGGYHRINKIFAQELDHIIELLNENLYAS